MPYIKLEERETINRPIEALLDSVHTPGQLNYVITRLFHRFIQRKHMVRYNLLNTMMGVLECAKQEFYRTIVAPYEDKKRKENGPISELDK